MTLAWAGAYSFLKASPFDCQLDWRIRPGLGEDNCRPRDLHFPRSGCRFWAESAPPLRVLATLKAANQPSKRKAALLGVGLDAPDEHKRLTRGKNFLLVGGSQETHAQMQETAIKLNEKLDQRGKRLEDVSVRELRDIFHEIEK